MNSVFNLMFVCCIDPIDFQHGVNDFDVGINESIFFDLFCMLNDTYIMNAPKCY